MSTPASQSQNAGGPSKGALSTPNKTPSSKHFRGGVVTVVVGDSKQEYIIHKDLLVFYSDYFRAAFNGSFVEASERKIELLEEDRKVFEQFHTWLYMRKLATDNDEPLSWDDLFDLWIFGDRFQVPMLQNCAMDEIFGKVRREDCFKISSVWIVYRKTVDGSLLRKALIDIITYTTVIGNAVGGIMSANNRAWLTVEILQDLVLELDAARKNGVAYETAPVRDKCHFHVHGKDEHC